MVIINRSSSSVIIPISVTVAAGTTTANFNIDTNAVAVGVSVTITATYNALNRTAMLVVNPPAPPPAPVVDLSALSVNPSAVVGGNVSQGVVTLTSAAPVGGALVTLSNDSIVAAFPVSVTVAEGATTANFNIDTDIVVVSASATITATYNGKALTAMLMVNPPEPPDPVVELSALSVNPSAVVGGNSIQGIVTLTSAAPSGGALVVIDSSSVSAIIPASVTVAAGATTENFIIDTDAVPVSVSATITATHNGEDRTAMLVVNPPPPDPDEPPIIIPPTPGPDDIPPQPGGGGTTTPGDPAIIFITPIVPGFSVGDIGLVAGVRVQFIGVEVDRVAVKNISTTPPLNGEVAIPKGSAVSADPIDTFLTSPVLLPAADGTRVPLHVISNTGFTVGRVCNVQGISGNTTVLYTVKVSSAAANVIIVTNESTGPASLGGNLRCGVQLIGHQLVTATTAAAVIPAAVLPPVAQMPDNSWRSLPVPSGVDVIVSPNVVLPSATVELEVENSNIFLRSTPPGERVVMIREFNELVVQSSTPTTLTVRNNEADDSTKLGGEVFEGDEVLGDFVNYTNDPTDLPPGHPPIPRPVREMINFHGQFISNFEARSFIAATRSRIYASTGTAGNWRILMEGLGGTPQPGDTPCSGPRWMAAQVGNYVLMTNDYDYVVSWAIGDGPSCANGDSAKFVSELVELGIRSAGCIASWKGTIFLGDIVTTEEGRVTSRIIWSDFDNPLGWVPVGESTSGYVDLGMTEKVLRMEPLAGVLRVYTDRAVYAVSLVGGEEVFRFVEIYRGPDALGFRFGLANCGDSHIYLTNTSIVEAQQSANQPVRVEWMNQASGFFFYGLNGALLDGYPGKFKGFREADPKACNEVVMGYDSSRREVWMSWPTLDTDEFDCAKKRRMTMVIARLYAHTSLIDHGFSSFCEFSPWEDQSVRDWMVDIGGCTVDEVSDLIWQKEGKPCSDPTEDVIHVPVEPTDPGWAKLAVEAWCLRTEGQVDVKRMCLPCTAPKSFSMASIKDFCLKELDPALRSREVYIGSETYEVVGYETIIQSESSNIGTGKDKRVRNLEVDYDHNTAESIPISLHSQLGVSSMPVCNEFWNSDPWVIDCVFDASLKDDTRNAGPAKFPFYSRGRYITWRLYVSVTGVHDFAPMGGDVNFNRVEMGIEPLKKC